MPPDGEIDDTIEMIDNTVEEIPEIPSSDITGFSPPPPMEENMVIDGEIEETVVTAPPKEEITREEQPAPEEETEEEEEGEALPESMMMLSPPPVVTRSGRKMVCSTCGAEGKYRCPGCKRESCSIECVAKHKETHECNGARKLEMVRAQDYNENSMKEDYFFLESIGSVIKGYHKKMPHHEPFSIDNLSTPLFYLREAAKTRGLHLTLLSRGMTKQSQNVTRFVAHNDTILWRVDFLIHNKHQTDPSPEGEEEEEQQTEVLDKTPLKVCRLVNERFILQEVIDNLPLLRERKLKKHAVWNMHWEARRKRRHNQATEGDEPVQEGSERGIVKKWDDKKGYGFISRSTPPTPPVETNNQQEPSSDANPDEQQQPSSNPDPDQQQPEDPEQQVDKPEPLPDLFVHRNSLTGEGGSLTVGAEVLFDIVEGDKPRAENVSGPAVCPLGKAGKSLLARSNNRKPKPPTSSTEETKPIPQAPEFGPGGKKPCDFYWRSGRCKHGDKCHFEHVGQNDVQQTAPEAEPELRIEMTAPEIESEEQHRDLCAELEGLDETMTSPDEERLLQKRKRDADEILADIMAPDEEEQYDYEGYDAEPPPVSHPPVVLYGEDTPVETVDVNTPSDLLQSPSKVEDSNKTERESGFVPEKSRWAIAVDKMREESRTPENRTALRQFMKESKQNGGYRIMVRALRLGNDVAFHELDKTETLAANLRKIRYVVEYPTIELFSPEEAANLKIITEEQIEQQRTQWQLTEKIPREKQPELSPDELRRMRKVPCKYFSMRGKCNNDLECHFLHAYEKPYCKTLQNLGMCPLKERCFFSHTRYDPEDPENKRKIPRELRQHFIEYSKDRMRDVRDVAAEIEAREKGLPLPIPSDEPQWKRLKRERPNNNNNNYNNSNNNNNNNRPRSYAVRTPTATSMGLAAGSSRIDPQKPQPVFPNRPAGGQQRQQQQPQQQQPQQQQPQQQRPPVRSYSSRHGPNGPPGPVRIPPRY